MPIVIIPVALCIAIFGLLLHFGKGVFLLSGITTLPAKQKARLNRRKLGRATAKLIWLLDVLIVLTGLSFEYGQPILAVFAIILCIIAAFSFAVYFETHKSEYFRE